MPKKLLVNIVAPDGRAGVATKLSLIRANHAAIGASAQNSRIYPAGKYVCIMHQNADGYQMLIIDVRGSREWADLILHPSDPGEGNEDLQQRFTTIAEVINSHYEAVKDDFELSYDPAL